MGRPRKYDSPEQMQIAIDNYFATTIKITICGLALHLGFMCRQSLLSYEGYSKEFFTTIKAAKSRVEQYYEEHLIESGAAGSIFALKNFKWSDKQEIDLKVEGDISFEILLDENSKKRQENNLEKDK